MSYDLYPVAGQLAELTEFHIGIRLARFDLQRALERCSRIPRPIEVQVQGTQLVMNPRVEGIFLQRLEMDDECPIDEICDGGQCLYHPLDGEAGEQVCGISALYFGFDSAQLSPNNQSELSAAAACLLELDGNLVIEAHADNVGTEEYNILLTDQRGSTVRDFLVQQGVPTERMRVVGKGALESSGDTEAERAKDRRVEFIVEAAGG